MVLISLVCSNMVANIIKIFETCKLFWPESEDFVNFATVFVNSATPRGRASKPRLFIFFLFRQKENRIKRKSSKTLLRPFGGKRQSRALSSEASSCGNGYAAWLVQECFLYKHGAPYGYSCIFCAWHASTTLIVSPSMT